MILYQSSDFLDSPLPPDCFYREECQAILDALPADGGWLSLLNWASKTGLRGEDLVLWEEAMENAALELVGAGIAETSETPYHRKRGEVCLHCGDLHCGDLEVGIRIRRRVGRSP